MIVVAVAIAVPRENLSLSLVTWTMIKCVHAFNILNSIFWHFCLLCECNKLFLCRWMRAYLTELDDGKCLIAYCITQSIPFSLSLSPSFSISFLSVFQFSHCTQNKRFSRIRTKRSKKMACNNIIGIVHLIWYTFQQITCIFPFMYANGMFDFWTCLP